MFLWITYKLTLHALELKLRLDHWHLYFHGKVKTQPSHINQLTVSQTSNPTIGEPLPPEPQHLVTHSQSDQSRKSLEI